MSEVKNLLEVEVKKNLESLVELEACTEEYKQTVSVTNNMIDKYCALAKDECDKQKDLFDKCSKILDIICKTTLSAAGLYLSYNAYKTSIAFEVDNTFTTTAGKETSRYLLGLSKPKI